MSLKEDFKNKLKSLTEAFNDFRRSPLPEPEIQKEMEAEGWKFHAHMPIPVSPYGAMIFPIMFVKTPEGRPAHNGNVQPEDRALFKETVTQKRIQHGLKP